MDRSRAFFDSSSSFEAAPWKCANFLEYSSSMIRDLH